MRSARILMISAALLVAACAGGGEKSPDEPDSREERSERDRRSDDDLSRDGKRWGGWRWKGRRENCFFVLDNRCFSSFKGACSAAKCERKKDCVHDDSAPANVSCKGDDD